MAISGGLQTNGIQKIFRSVIPAYSGDGDSILQCSAWQIDPHLSLSTGETIFYRTAGSPHLPTLLLLHGFPSSSHQYRHLLPLLSTTHHVIAPDLPGFGFTTVPADYTYTFASLTLTLLSFLSTLSISRFRIYIFDYGTPNGNAFEAGLTPFWDPVKALWAYDTPEQREKVANAILTLEATRWQYEDGVPDAERVKQIQPEGYTLDYALMSREGGKEVQLALLRDYEGNVEMYPEFQRWMRESKVPVLAVWGGNDKIFGREGAEAFGKVGGEVVLLDGGHFLLETHLVEVVEVLKGFLERVGKW
ncbi:alpha/beta hydrolase fold protein [Wilcoxina mikolae CBS 423.85]|nr:alpha/beta hydrolase fold protein [Wilcoxina mikolae CBS 423.85]